MPTNVRHSQATQAQGHSVTTIASFGGIKYYVDPKPAQVISFQPSRPTDGFFGSLNGDLRPCTVIDDSIDHLNMEGLGNIASFFAHYDDVWTSAFLEGETNRWSQTCNRVRLLTIRRLLTVIIFETHRTSRICVAQDGKYPLFQLELTDLQPGPYAIRPSTGEIFRVLRLHEDDCCAFVGGSVAFSAQPRYFQWLVPRVSKARSTMAASLTFIRIV